MIDPHVYRQPTPLDRVHHRALRMTREAGDPAATASANAVFVPFAEFEAAGREYPIVFVRAGADPADPSKPDIAPMAVLGLAANENLYLDGAAWRAEYLPAYVRRYPFAMARMEPGSEQRAFVIDRAWSGFSETEGERLFDDAGAPTPLLERHAKFTEQFEAETERTRHGCAHLREADLLRDMRFEATLPDGGNFTVDGFLVVDEQKLRALPDAQVLELHRNGLLALIHLHRASLGLMRRLVERRLARGAAPS